MHSLTEAKEIAQNVLNRGVGINLNDELKLSAEFLKQ
jgi:S-ribosylhomocysteine lyase